MNWIIPPNLFRPSGSPLLRYFVFVFPRTYFSLKNAFSHLKKTETPSYPAIPNNFSDFMKDSFKNVTFESPADLFEKMQQALEAYLDDKNYPLQTNDVLYSLYKYAKAVRGNSPPAGAALLELLDKKPNIYLSATVPLLEGSFKTLLDAAYPNPVDRYLVTLETLASCPQQRGEASLWSYLEQQKTYSSANMVEEIKKTLNSTKNQPSDYKKAVLSGTWGLPSQQDQQYRMTKTLLEILFYTPRALAAGIKSEIKQKLFVFDENQYEKEMIFRKGPKAILPKEKETGLVLILGNTPKGRSLKIAKAIGMSLVTTGVAQAGIALATLAFPPFGGIIAASTYGIFRARKVVTETQKLLKGADEAKKNGIPKRTYFKKILKDPRLLVGFGVTIVTTTLNAMGLMPDISALTDFQASLPDTPPKTELPPVKTFLPPPEVMTKTPLVEPTPPIAPEMPTLPPVQRILEGMTLGDFAQQYNDPSEALPGLWQANLENPGALPEPTNPNLLAKNGLLITPLEDDLPKGSDISLPTETSFSIEAAKAGFGTHRIMPGDTLSTIARDLSTNVKELMAINQETPGIISEGKILALHEMRIPAPQAASIVPATPSAPALQP